MGINTLRRELFAREYIKDLCGANAARRLGIAEGSARSEASRLLDEPGVQERIAELIAERNVRTNIDADTVLREIHAIATADVNELVEYRRVNCRHCWGLDFKYQYTTARTLQYAQRKFEATVEGLVDAFEHGGIGFTAKREPNPECPECDGEGYGEVHFKDTRTLSPTARALYAGAKVTKDGIEIKLHDKVKNLELLARHLGLLNDKLEVVAKGDLASRLIAGRKRVGG